MGLRGIKTDLETLRDLLAGVSDSPATPDSIQPDLDEITKLLSKLLADTDEIADVVMERISTALGQLKRCLTEASGGTKIILLDVDGTLVDVNDRAIHAMKDAGVEVGSGNWQDFLPDLEYPAKEVFYRAFLSDKYASMDREFGGVFNQVKKLYDREQLPVVVLTGRPSKMAKSTENVVSTLMGKGIPVRELIMRPDEEAKTKAPAYKVKMLQQRGYDPKFIFDDDHRVLSGLASAFPNANIFRVDGGSIRKYQTASESVV